MAFTEQLHPRGKGAQGGQFVTKNSAGQSTTTRQIGYAGKNKGTGYGSKSGDPNVKSLQRELNRLGILDGQGNQLLVDGKFGPKTTAAVRRLQIRLGLHADGKVTPELLNRIKKMQPSRHDRHVMHLRHVKANHSRHERHVKHVQHEKAKAGAKAPAKRTPPARVKPAARKNGG